MGTPKERNDTEIWLRSLGCNISDAEMKKIMMKIEKNSTLLFYFAILKEHVKPKEESIRIHKYYLYDTLKNGGFGVEIPSHCTVTSHRDLELTRSYLKSTYKRQAFKMIKIPQATAELEKSHKVLSTKKNVVRLLTQDLMKNPACLLDRFRQHLIATKDEIKMKQKCVKAFLNPDGGSEEFQIFVSAKKRKENIIQTIQNISFESVDNNVSINTDDKLLLSNILEKMIECSPKRYIATINSFILNPTLQVSNNSILNGEKMIDYLERYRHLYSLVESLKFSSLKLIEDIQNYSAKKEDALSKIDKIGEEVGLIFQMKLETNSDKVKVKTNVLTHEQYLAIENILNSWGESLKSPQVCLTECFKRKHADYECYQLIHKIVSSMTDSPFSYSVNRENPVNSIRRRNEELTDHFDKIHCLTKTNNDISNEVIKLLNQMPFFKIHGKPITDIIKEVKLAITDLELGLTFNI